MPRAVPFALAALSLVLLAGCTPAATTADPTTGPTESVAPTSEPTPTPTAAPIGTPIDVSCDQLVSADTIYAFNPNFGAITDFTPKPGSAAASALEYQGIACRWQNQTDGSNIDLSIADLDDDSLTALKNAAYADSEPVPTYGDEAYFAITGDVGTAIVFQGSYWLVAESAYFGEPGDAEEIVNSALAALP